MSLVTDAMAAAGMADGAYRIGPLAVEVAGAVAHLAGTDTIAGSTATMDRLFRFAVTGSGLPRDAALLAGGSPVLDQPCTGARPSQPRADRRIPR